MEEHKVLLQIFNKSLNLLKEIQRQESVNQVYKHIEELEKIARDFLNMEKHYLMEENVLFPLLEKHSITEPPTIMWVEHNQLREKKEEFYSVIKNYRLMNFQNFKKTA